VAVAKGHPMTEPSEELPEVLKQAFREAVQRYSEWQFSGPEPRMLYAGSLVKISAISDFVSDYDNAEMAAVDFTILYNSLRDMSERPIKESLGRDASYHNVARCLRQLVNAKNKRFKNS
jgi:hypothetical protein